MVKALIVLMAVFVCGCAVPLPGLTMPNAQSSQTIQTMTNVQLTKNNYRLLKTNVVGTDWGVNLLGVIPIVSPDWTKAMAEVYNTGGITEGGAYAITNILQQHTSPFFILFSVPKIKISADVVEFTNERP